MRNRLVSVFLLLIAFGVRTFRLAQLGAQSDEGVHITIAERLAAGDILYLELFENRTPAVEWFLALLFKVAGPSVLLGRALGVAMALVTVAALIAAGRLLQHHFLKGAATRRSERNWAGWIAAASFALAPLAVFWGRFTMLEHWQAAAATLSIACALIAATRGRASWWLAAGALAGASLMAKQTGITLLFAYAAYFLLAYLSGKRPNSHRAPLAMVAGVLLLPLAGLILLGLQGSLGSFFNSLSGVSRLAPLYALDAKWLGWLSWAIRRPLVFLGLAGGVFIVLSGFSAAWIGLFWGIAEMGALFAPPELTFGLSGFSHYVVPSLAAVSLLAGAGSAWLIGAAAGSKHGRLIAAGAALLLILAVPAWLTDLDTVVRQSTYPQPDMSEELAIGRAVAAVTDETQTILVLGNGIFYHLAGRAPANRYFHYPAYLPDSSLGAASEKELRKVLSGGRLAAVLLSREHMEDRLPDGVLDALWNNWTPAARFQYAYQDDMILLLPRPAPAKEEGAYAATFGSGIQLVDLTVRSLDPESLIVQVQWHAMDEQSVDWTVFVHVLDSEGTLVGQHDGPPGVGFRPASTWRQGETIFDTHWITLAQVAQLEGLTLSIGLYDPATGERLRLLGGAEPADAFSVAADK